MANGLSAWLRKQADAFGFGQYRSGAGPRRRIQHLLRRLRHRPDAGRPPQPHGGGAGRQIPRWCARPRFGHSPFAIRHSEVGAAQSFARACRPTCGRWWSGSCRCRTRAARRAWPSRTSPCAASSGRTAARRGCEPMCEPWRRRTACAALRLAWPSNLLTSCLLPLPSKVS